MLSHHINSGIISRTNRFVSRARCSLAPKLVCHTVARVEVNTTVWGTTGWPAGGLRAIGHGMRPPTTSSSAPYGQGMSPPSRSRRGVSVRMKRGRMVSPWSFGCAGGPSCGTSPAATPTPHPTLHQRRRSEGPQQKEVPTPRGRSKSFSGAPTPYLQLLWRHEKVGAKESLKLFEEIGRRIAEVSEEKRSTCFLLQRLSIAVQREHVAAILGTLPAGKELDEIFIL